MEPMGNNKIDDDTDADADVDGSECAMVAELLFEKGLVDWCNNNIHKYIYRYVGVVVLVGRCCGCRVVVVMK
jgi:hypothetical protein